MHRLPPSLLADFQPEKPEKPEKAGAAGHQPDTNRMATGYQPDEPDFGGQVAGRPEKQNIWGAVRQWVQEAPGKFSTCELDRDLGLTTPRAKKSRSDALSKLVSEGLIERVSSIRGGFRIKNQDLVEMDLLAASPAEIPIDLPFGLSKYIEINSKEIILIAGETNTGKTAIQFNMAWSCINTLHAEGILREKTAKPHKEGLGLRYFSSEMGPTGVRKKLEAFGSEYPIEKWVKYVSTVERNREFQDVVDPHGINFIDFLEALDGEYYKLSSDITAIHAALETGIAVIAIQKRSGTDIGRGGEATLEKPRLALSLSENKEKGFATVKIVKAKHYRDRNPVGLERDFIIRRRGTKIIEVSPWGYAKDHQVRRNSQDYRAWNQE